MGVGLSWQKTRGINANDSVFYWCWEGFGFETEPRVKSVQSKDWSSVGCCLTYFSLYLKVKELFLLLFLFC